MTIDSDYLHNTDHPVQPDAGAARRVVTHRILPTGHRPIVSLEDYVIKGGLEGLNRAVLMAPGEIIGAVKAAGLRGRGGAGFPAGVKWATVAADECPDKFVVCNAAEGEPGTYKDRYLIQKNPYQLIEGILIAARAISARQAVIGIKQKFTAELKRLRQAIAEYEQAEIFAPGFIEVFEGPDDYLFGEEKALIEAIDGRGALPRNLPPYMVGIKTTPAAPNPTIVNNVETLSNVPVIFAAGVERYRQTGTPATPGTMIFTLSGDVRKPGMYELPMGTALSALLCGCGRGPLEGRTIKAVFSGVANCVITPDQFDTPLDFDAMKQAGSGLGSGGFMVFDDSTCIVQAALMFSRFLSQSSCGQCFPCSASTARLTEIFERLEQGRATTADLDDIRYACGRATNQTRCYLPNQAVNLITSVVQKFSHELMEHLEGPCGCQRPLRLPKIAGFDERIPAFQFE